MVIDEIVGYVLELHKKMKKNKNWLQWEVERVEKYIDNLNAQEELLEEMLDEREDDIHIENKRMLLDKLEELDSIGEKLNTKHLILMSFVRRKKTWDC